ncbi:MAG: hypothetical protein QM705_14330 [Ancrocorticia sp.]
MSDTTVGGAGSFASLPTESIDVLRDYLDAAPAELAEWAREQREHLDSLVAQRAAEDASSSPEEGSSGSTTTSRPEASETPGSPVVGFVDASDIEVVTEEDESEDFYNDMEGEDDILQRRRTPGAKRSRVTSRASRARGPARSDASDTATVAPSASAARVSGGVSAPPRRGWAGLSVGARFALVALLIVGIVGGVKLAGQGKAENTAVGSTPTMSSAAASGEVAARIAELTSAIEKNPQAVEERLELGVLYFNDRYIDKAQVIWLEVTELAPDNVSAWYNLGFSYLSMDPAQMDKAKEAWQRVVDLDPESQMAKTVSMHLQGFTDTDPGQDSVGVEQQPAQPEQAPEESGEVPVDSSQEGVETEQLPADPGSEPAG